MNAAPLGASPLEVVHVDNHLLAVGKPACLPCVPDASGDDSLLEQAREWVRLRFDKPGRAWLGVVHRLDRPVSGLVLFARTSKSAARLSEALRAHELEKRYLALGEGECQAPDEGVLEQWLVKDPERNTSRVVAAGAPGARLARTRWRVLEREHGLTLYALEPATGRAHQLRLAARALGTPLLGDVRYGAREPLPDRSLALHACGLTLAHPTTRARIALRLAPPRSAWWRRARARFEAEAREG